MPKTRRSNEPFKRHHWKAARTERRGRFAHAIGLWRKVPESQEMGLGMEFMEPQDQDMAFRRRGGWLTTDKSHVRYMFQHGTYTPEHAHNPLLKRVHLRGIDDA